MKIFVISCFLISHFLCASFDDVPKLSLRGEGIIKKMADQVKLSVGVTTEGETSKKALEENSKRMNQVVEALKKLQLKSLTFETGVFSIQPRYTTRPLKASLEWKPQIEGYLAQNTLNITLEEMESIPLLIDTLADANANTFGDLQFLLKNEREFRGKAIEQAFTNAKNDAEALAGAALQNLGKVLFLSLDDSHVTPFMMKSSMLLTRGSDAPPIQAGEVEVRASVNVIYQLVGEELNRLNTDEKAS